MAAARQKRFRWGRFDCCQFAAGCVAAVTGRDARDLFEHYRTRRQAEQILATVGGMEGLITRALGAPVHPSRASLGDIVLIDMGAGPQPAVCSGVNCFAPARGKGLEPWPMRFATAAWII
jgi:hypothetical protein